MEGLINIRIGPVFNSKSMNEVGNFIARPFFLLLNLKHPTIYLLHLPLGGRWMLPRTNLPTNDGRLLLHQALAAAAARASSSSFNYI